MEPEPVQTVLDSDSPYSGRLDWYPRHMARAMREIKERLKLVDVVLEVRDARLPLTSGNPELNKVLGNKKRLVVVNKANLAEEESNQLWKRWFLKQGIDSLFVNALDKRSVRGVLPVAKKLMSEKWENYKKRGIRPPPLRMMVLGIPNSGKSTIINQLSGRNKVKTGKMPGVTLHQQWIVIVDNLELLDTPGVMTPSIDTEEQALMLCGIHAIKDELISIERIANFILTRYLESEVSNLKSYYQLPEISEGNLNLFFQQLGEKKRLLLGDGKIDLEKSYRLFLEDFRKGKLGRKSFETPPDIS